MSESMDWPIERPEHGVDLARARLAIARCEDYPMDVGRVVAGAILDKDREALCFLLGALPHHEEVAHLLPVVEAGLVRLGAFE
ncbi:MAG TPA: hypothetical protein VFR97_02300 [Capillimicrobium sp.]|nr:hypothetical protein [Capillimicrobium sp.]